MGTVTEVTWGGGGGLLKKKLFTDKGVPGSNPGSAVEFFCKRELFHDMY